jgi:hypothetical protein
MRTKKVLLALLFPMIALAQIGVGTSNVDPSAKFQIDAADKGFLQPRVELTGTDDVATIASPATGLMVFNTATAGSGAAAVTPGVYYHNGAAWQRVANQAEVATASSATPTTFVNGNLGTTLQGDVNGYYDPYSPLGAKNFGATITLPPGKWEVNLDLTVDISSITHIQPAIIWMNYWLDENTPSNSLYYEQVIDGSTIGTSDALFTGGASFVRVVGAANSDHSGVFYINNASQADKTYTLYFFESLPYNGCPDFDCIRIFYNKFGGALGWPGNRFYAKKIN